MLTHMLTYAGVCWRMLTMEEWQLAVERGGSGGAAELRGGGALLVCGWVRVGVGVGVGVDVLPSRQHTSAYVSIRQHTSAYVSIRQHTSAYGCVA